MELCTSQFQLRSSPPRVFYLHSRAFDQRFSKKSNTQGFAPGGMIAVGIDLYIKDFVIVWVVV